MASPSGRFTVMFNGEIYNHLDLRRELCAVGYKFRGHSDTETLCAAFEHWGLAPTVKRCIGMFAIAVWDQQTRELSLIRDRLGIKPLYLYHTADMVLFGSELKALRAHEAFRSELDPAALEMFLKYLYIPAPATIYQRVRKLTPGHIVTVSLPNCEVRSEPYWSLHDAYVQGKRNPFDGSEREGTDALEELLLDAVRLRKLSDVPLGALLSGGIDSTTVVAMMQVGASEPARTFSIGFSSAEHDESVHAAAIAKHLGTRHKAMMLDGSESMAVITELPHIFDEPFADPSQIPTLLVSRMARQDVTVALTGDGGDELFGGYNRYIHGHRLITRSLRIPSAVRHAGSKAVNALADDWYPTVAPLMSMSGQRLGQQKLKKLGRVLAGGSSDEMYLSLLSAWQNPAATLLYTQPPSDPIRQLLGSKTDMPLLDKMMLVDQATYLPDELLAKVDRASMAVSLEARVPILDHRVVEFSWRIPEHWKIRHGRGKWLLREVLHRHVPKELVERPKVGFTVPIDEWLRGPLRPWAEESLQTLDERIDRASVMTAWKRFQNGEPGVGLGLWAVIMFQKWKTAWDT
jgi:asparagine synthase (glutamine-hydrolysing)